MLAVFEYFGLFFFSLILSGFTPFCVQPYFSVGHCQFSKCPFVLANAPLCLISFSIEVLSSNQPPFVLCWCYFTSLFFFFFPSFFIF
ncbi:hypothetical protein DFJ73DRAFT_880766, partial [Zopfochytrium polystomum]